MLPGVESTTLDLPWLCTKHSAMNPTNSRPDTSRPDISGGRAKEYPARPVPRTAMADSCAPVSPCAELEAEAVLDALFFINGGGCSGAA